MTPTGEGKPSPTTERDDMKFIVTMRDIEWDAPPGTPGLPDHLEITIEDAASEEEAEALALEAASDQHDWLIMSFTPTTEAIP